MAAKKRALVFIENSTSIFCPFIRISLYTGIQFPIHKWVNNLARLSYLYASNIYATNLTYIYRPDIFLNLFNILGLLFFHL